MQKLGVILSAIVLIGISCRKPDQYSDVPTLAFKSVIFSSDPNLGVTFTLTATFTDGDGDIGYYQDQPNGPIFDDPSSKYYSNFVITLLRLKNGVWTDTIHYLINTQYIDTIFPIITRIPYLTPEGKNKGLKGDINKTEVLPLGLNDTIKFNAFIYDRALNKSNVVESPAYFINTQ